MKLKHRWLKSNNMKIIGNRIYDVCRCCGKIICLNKFLFSSLHICINEEERKIYAEEIKKNYRFNKNYLMDIENLIEN